jgi:hypothetical protein
MDLNGIKLGFNFSNCNLEDLCKLHKPAGVVK